jgi:hypothetical protein
MGGYWQFSGSEVVTLLATGLLAGSASVGTHYPSSATPARVDPERFHLLGNYEKDPSRWLEMPWFDKYSGRSYRIGVGRATPGDRYQVKSYRTDDRSDTLAPNSVRQCRTPRGGEKRKVGYPGYGGHRSCR